MQDEIVARETLRGAAATGAEEALERIGLPPRTSRRRSRSRHLDSLVLSSGDFGLAYLNERWAARFVSELFRNFTVCFVGYSLDDPVLRYMMDALAADKRLGESSPEMFAFGCHSKGKEDDVAEEWKAKNVTPILYREHQRHAYLHRTLRVWADTYRVGVLGEGAHRRAMRDEPTKGEHEAG